MVDEGFLQKQQGRGTFVLASRLAEPLADPEHFLLSGFDAEDPEPHQGLQRRDGALPRLDPGQARSPLDEPVHKIRKVLSPDGEPAAFRTSFVPVAIAPRLPQADLSLPLYSLVETMYGVTATEADEVIEFIVADDFRAGMLDVEVGHPIILVERIIFSEAGEALECSRSYYRADRFRLRHHLRRADAPARILTTRGSEEAENSPSAA